MHFRLDDRRNAGGDAHADAMTTIAHDLRTPLTTTRSVSEILRDHPDLPASQREAFIAMLAEETDRLQQTVERVLSSSSAGHGRWCVDMDDFSLRSVET